MIFDTLDNKPITCKWLKARGYRRIVWGAPDYQIQPKRDEHGHPIFTGRRENYSRWRRNSFAWERGGIVYFPKAFNKYVNAVNRHGYPNRAVITHDELIENIKTTNDLECIEVYEHSKRSHRRH